MIRLSSISPVQRDQKTNNLVCLQFNSSNPTPSSISCFQSVTKTQLEVCLKDIQRYDASHDPITVNYMAIGSKYKQKNCIRIRLGNRKKLALIDTNNSGQQCVCLFSLRY